MTSKQVLKFKKKLFNKFNSIDNPVDKVDIRAVDMQKVDQWLKLLHERGTPPPNDCGPISFRLHYCNFRNGWFRSYWC